MFANKEHSLRSFRESEVWPWSVTNMRYAKGADYSMSCDIVLEIEIKAHKVGIWLTRNGIRLHFPENSHGEIIVSEVLLAKQQALCVFREIKKLSDIELGNLDTPVIDNLNYERGDLRLQELVFNAEKYLFLDVDLREWVGDSLKIMLPLSASWQNNLPLIDSVKFLTNCISASCAEKKIMDPIRHDSLTTQYPLLWIGNADLCAVASITVDGALIRDFSVYRENGK